MVIKNKGGFSGRALAVAVGGVGADVGSGRVISSAHMVFKLSEPRAHTTLPPLFCRDFLTSHLGVHAHTARR